MNIREIQNVSSISSTKRDVFESLLITFETSIIFQADEAVAKK